MATIKVKLLNQQGDHVDSLRLDPETISVAHTLVYHGKHYAYRSMPRFALYEVEFQEVQPPVFLTDAGEVRPAPQILTRSTHTFALMELSVAAHAEILKSLRDAGYDHAIDGDALDMHGIAVIPVKEGDANG